MDSHCAGDDGRVRRQSDRQSAVGAALPGTAVAGEEHRQRDVTRAFVDAAGQGPGDGGVAGGGPV